MGCLCNLYCPLGSIPQENIFFTSTLTTPLVTSLIKTKRWMNNIDDNTSISTLSIPGTHDSATYSCTCLAIPKISQCQVMNFYEQLQSGIRYLDIRIKTKNGEILMVHGIIELQSFQEAVKQVSTFMKENPLEFILMAFQNRDNGINSAAEKIIEMLDNTKLDIPTVGQLRGKVWLLKGYDTNFDPPTFEVNGAYGVTDQEWLYLQNYYINDQNTTLSRKCEESKKCSFQVKNNKEGVDHPRLRVNFLSIAGPEVWTVAFTGPFPYQMALDPEGPNAKMSRELQERGVVSAGILIMDFPGHRLIQNIINSNHFKQEL